MRHISEVQAEVYRDIRARLLRGQLRSRRDLSCRRLAGTLGVSPSCVLNVLGRLKTEGLLVSRPQGGTMVRQLTDEEFRQAYQVRQWIEPHAAAEAARHVTAPQLAALERACAGLEKLTRELQGSAETDTPAKYLERQVHFEHVFHGTIMKAARNDMAAHAVENLRILNHVTWHNHTWPRTEQIANLQLTNRQHRGIVAALRAGDSKLSRQRSREHLRLPPQFGSSDPDGEERCDHDGARTVRASGRATICLCRFFKGDFS